MAERAISVRLDEEAERALRALMDAGVSQSEAIRRALIETALSDRRQRARLDVERYAQDPENLELIAAVRAEMDELRAPW